LPQVMRGHEPDSRANRTEDHAAQELKKFMTVQHSQTHHTKKEIRQ